MSRNTAAVAGSLAPGDLAGDARAWTAASNMNMRDRALAAAARAPSRR